MTTTNTTPRVYVDTHGKYNHGSAEAGSWVDLEQFAGAQAAFLAYCAQIRAAKRKAGATKRRR